MVDRLIGVGGEFAAWEPSRWLRLMAAQRVRMRAVTRASRPAGVAAAVALEVELVFEAVDDRFDPLPDRSRSVGWPVGLVGSAGTK